MNEQALAEGIEAEIDSLVPAQSFDRRRFIVTSLGAGFAASVLPVAAQTVIRTDTQGIVAGEVEVPTRDGRIPAYRAMPATGSSFPTVVVISEVFGVHEHIADVTRRLAKAGYYAIAAELFARQGDARAVTDTARLLADIVAKASDAQVLGDLDASVAFAKSEGKADVSKLGVTGFCWGGRMTWMYTAHNPSVKAAVAWYGPVARAYFPGDKTALDVAANVGAPVLGLYGGADSGIPNETLEKMRAALKAAGNTKSEIVVYPDTPHGFNADYRPTYRKGAAEDGWKRMLAWFKANGVA